MNKTAFFEGVRNWTLGPKPIQKFTPYAPSTIPRKSILTPDLLEPNFRKQVESGNYTPQPVSDQKLGEPTGMFSKQYPRAQPVMETAPQQTAPTITPEHLAQFRRGTASQFDPKSRVDRAKMNALLNGNKDWAVRKSAFIKMAAMPEDYHAYRKEKDRTALRNRHIALALKRALQGGIVGAVANKATNLDDENALTKGLIGGALLGGGVGALEGASKRTLGLDPMLDTTLIANRA